MGYAYGAVRVHLTKAQVGKLQPTFAVLPNISCHVQRAVQLWLIQNVDLGNRVLLGPTRQPNGNQKKNKNKTKLARIKIKLILKTFSSCPELSCKYGVRSIQSSDTVDACTLWNGLKEIDNPASWRHFPWIGY